MFYALNIYYIMGERKISFKPFSKKDSSLNETETRVKDIEIKYKEKSRKQT